MDSPHYSVRERAALALTDALTATPQAVDDATFERARAHFTDDELVELVATAAWENAVSRFNHAFGVEAIGLWHLTSGPGGPGPKA